MNQWKACHMRSNHRVSHHLLLKSFQLHLKEEKKSCFKQVTKPAQHILCH
jgi:hypothetical protein